MGKLYGGIDAALQSFIEAQHVFFVATAPLGTSGHVNVSPKGLNALRIFDPHTLGYLDFVGSGAETIAHLRENQRIVVMLCAFQGAPRIVRLHGYGEVIEPPDPEFARLRPLFAPATATRAIIRVAVDRISDSCGYGVPLFEFKGERPQLSNWAERKGEDGLTAYQKDKNHLSIDGLPALRWTESSDDRT